MKRKGFAHFIEVSFAILIFTLSILTSLSSVDIKTSFSSHGLVVSGLSITQAMENLNIIDNIFDIENFEDEIDFLIPKNMYYGIYVKGSPRSLIKVGCANCTGREYAFLKSVLTPVYYNKRWVNFSVSVFDFTSLSDATEYHLLVFVNFSNFDENDLIKSYTALGGRILAITDITDSNFDGIDETFSLQKSSGISSYLTFSDTREPWIAKYFAAAGLEVEASNSVENKNNGKWVIWGEEKDVNITSNLEVEIEDVGKLREGDVFCLNANSENPSLPDKDYCFKIRKVFPELLFIQTLNYSFPFLDFSDDVKVLGIKEDENILSTNDYSLVVINKTTSGAVWISFFPEGSEYRALLKSIIMALNTEFSLITFRGETGMEIPIYYQACCDIPETLKITLKLGYKY